MKKLHELLHQVPCKGDVGIEIETEGKNLGTPPAAMWRTEDDGSLRGDFPHSRAEYVTVGAIPIKEVSSTLDTLINAQKKAELSFSFRTSVHVHVNVQELTEDEMLAYLYLCLLVEEPLMNFCGDSRKGNRFCLRLGDAEGYDKTLEKLFKDGARCIPRLDGGGIRYAAINIHSLKKYGSIEFRGMRGNLDKAVLIPWCETLVHLREAAKALGSPVAVYNEYLRLPHEEFIKKTLGGHSELFSYGTLSEDVCRSFSLTIDMPHVYKSRPLFTEVALLKPAIQKYDFAIERDNIELFTKEQLRRIQAITDVKYLKTLDEVFALTLEQKIDLYQDIYEQEKANAVEELEL